MRLSRQKCILERFLMPMENLDLLYEITQALTAPGPLPRSLNQILQILAQRMGMRRGTITILTPETAELQIDVAHGLTAEAVDHADLGGAECVRRIDHVAEQGFAGQRMQHLGQVGSHARAFAGSEDEDVERGGHGGACRDFSDAKQAAHQV
jgi:transcriptional regulator with GAF, ATPase, and Fis domain